MMVCARSGNQGYFWSHRERAYTLMISMSRHAAWLETAQFVRIASKPEQLFGAPVRFRQVRTPILDVSRWDGSVSISQSQRVRAAETSASRMASPARATSFSVGARLAPRRRDARPTAGTCTNATTGAGRLRDVASMPRQ
jgi:hypothetical protein